jgi:hypothetical protein
MWHSTPTVVLAHLARIIRRRAAIKLPALTARPYRTAIAIPRGRGTTHPTIAIAIGIRPRGTGSRRERSPVTADMHKIQTRTVIIDINTNRVRTPVDAS